MATPIKLGYVILYVPDVIAAAHFYERAFGLTRRFVHDSGQYAEMETGATALAFANEAFVSATGHTFRPNRPDQEPAAAEIAFVADDVDTTFETAIKAGAVSYDAPRLRSWGQTVAYVRDANGFLVELCSAIGNRSKQPATRNRLTCPVIKVGKRTSNAITPALRA